MLELAETVIRLTGSNSKVVFRDLPSDDPRQRKPIIDKARELLAWEPKIDLEAGIIKTIEYFKGVI
jgi:UDP-glucuronate decarboxylase